MIYDKMTIDDVELTGKKVLTRLDLNVPIQDGEVADDERIVRALPTIKKIVDDGAVAILCSHLGRPKGQRIDSLSLKPVAQRISEHIGQEVKFLDDCIGSEVEQAIDSAIGGDIILLENLRFHAGEKKKDEAFTKALASLGEVYVNDAFGTAHRDHASNVGVSAIIKPSVAGYLMLDELRTFHNILENPKRPFISIIGGLKVSSKTAVIENLLPKVDKLLLGGGLIFTFYNALGLSTGKSYVEKDLITRAGGLLSMSEEDALEAGDSEGKIVLPLDVLVTDDIDSPSKIETVPYEEIPDKMIGVDIGKSTAELFASVIQSAGTVILTGPMGIFEKEEYSRGTRIILDAMVAATERGGITAVGGGDSVSAAKKLIDPDKLTHISTGGGASLQVIEGKPLPAVEALTDR
ncbi:MAG: phosphoglycerate kinase [Candidatus Zixiibacteriota bacterium]